MTVKKLKYQDILTAPNESKKISYSGPEPFKFLGKMTPLLKAIMEIGSPNIHEKDIRWDQTDGSFYYEIQAVKPFDRWSRFIFKMRAWGSQGDDPKKMGSMTMKLKGVLETEIEYYHSIHKSIWWTYAYLFYNKQRKKYFDISRKMFFTIENALREMLGVPIEKIKRISVPKGAGYNY